MKIGDLRTLDALERLRRSGDAMAILLATEYDAAGDVTSERRRLLQRDAHGVDRLRPQTLNFVFLECAIANYVRNKLHRLRKIRRRDVDVDVREVPLRIGVKRCAECLDAASDLFGRTRFRSLRQE